MDKTKSTVVGINYSILILIMIINCLRNNENWIYVITAYLILIALYTGSFFLCSISRKIVI